MPSQGKQTIKINIEICEFLSGNYLAGSVLQTRTCRPQEKNMKDKAIPSLGCIYEGQTFPFGKSQQHIIISSRNSRMNQSDAAMPKTKQYLGCEVFKELQECHALCTLDILNRYITYHYHRIPSSH